MDLCELIEVEEELMLSIEHLRCAAEEGYVDLDLEYKLAYDELVSVRAKIVKKLLKELKRRVT